MTIEDQIIKSVCNAFGVPTSNISMKGKNNSLCYMRTAIIHFLSSQLGMSSREIGDYLGWNRTTVVGCKKRHESYYKYVPEYKNGIDSVNDPIPHKVIKEVRKVYSRVGISEEQKREWAIKSFINELIDDKMILINTFVDDNGSGVIVKLISHESEN